MLNLKIIWKNCAEKFSSCFPLIKKEGQTMEQKRQAKRTFVHKMFYKNTFLTIAFTKDKKILIYRNHPTYWFSGL